MLEVENIIAGGGICGLLLARKLHQVYPNSEICVLEKELYVGEHSSGRNSGVLHAGIYYPTNSKKHLLCIRGNQLWRELSKELNFEIQNCGKYIIATSEDEKFQLKSIFQQALKNKVPGIRQIENSEIQELAEHVKIVDGLFSGTTAVIDLSGSIKAIENDLFKKNIPVMVGHKIIDIKRHEEKFLISVASPEGIIKILCKKIFNLAGLEAIKLRKLLGLNNLELKMVKGNYLKSTQKLFHKNLIYPIPKEDLKGLGIHTSFDISGVIRFGPNVEDIHHLNYKIAENLRAQMFPEISKIFKNIDKDSLFPDYCGIRSKILLDNKLYPDFWIKNGADLGQFNYFEACGIESPGYTSAPAIAEAIVNML